MDKVVLIKKISSLDFQNFHLYNARGSFDYIMREISVYFYGNYSGHTKLVLNRIWKSRASNNKNKCVPTLTSCFFVFLLPPVYVKCIIYFRPSWLHYAPIASGML